MVKKSSKVAADEVITSDTIENKRLLELVIDHGVSSSLLILKTI
jgi:hypothetical protein